MARVGTPRCWVSHRAWACVRHLRYLDSLPAFSEGETAQVGISDPRGWSSWSRKCGWEGLGMGRPQREAGGQGRQRALFSSGHTCQPPPPAFALFLLSVSLLTMTPYKVHSLRSGHSQSGAVFPRLEGERSVEGSSLMPRSLLEDTQWGPCGFAWAVASGGRTTRVSLSSYTTDCIIVQIKGSTETPPSPPTLCLSRMPSARK